MIYAVVNPSGQPIGPFASMADAQAAIAELEPDIIAQGLYKIHPIANARDAEAAKINVIWKVKLEKFDGETGELVETVEREGVN